MRTLFAMEHASTTLVPDVGRRRAKVDGSKVRALRAHLALTQRDLAEKARVEQRTVARWEQEIDYVVWLGILNACGLPPEWEPEPVKEVERLQPDDTSFAGRLPRAGG